MKNKYRLLITRLKNKILFFISILKQKHPIISFYSLLFMSFLLMRFLVIEKIRKIKIGELNKLFCYQESFDLFFLFKKITGFSVYYSSIYFFIYRIGVSYFSYLSTIKRYYFKCNSFGLSLNSTLLHIHILNICNELICFFSITRFLYRSTLEKTVYF